MLRGSVQASEPLEAGFGKRVGTRAPHPHIRRRLYRTRRRIARSSSEHRAESERTWASEGTFLKCSTQYATAQPAVSTLPFPGGKAQMSRGDRRAVFCGYARQRLLS